MATNQRVPGRGFEFQADLEPVTAHVAAQYHNAHGGSSFYVHGGNRATTGFAVGGMKNVPEQTIDSHRITPEQFQANRDRIRNLQPHDANAVAGSWEESGHSVLDGTSVLRNQDAAKRLQVSRGERAVYDLGADKEVDLR